jgi:hypothetical protein
MNSVPVCSSISIKLPGAVPVVKVEGGLESLWSLRVRDGNLWCPSSKKPTKPNGHSHSLGGLNLVSCLGSMWIIQEQTRAAITRRSSITLHSGNPRLGTCGLALSFPRGGKGRIILKARLSNKMPSHRLLFIIRGWARPMGGW